MDSTDIRTTHWKPKACDICGESDHLRLLGERSIDRPVEAFTD